MSDADSGGDLLAALRQGDVSGTSVLLPAVYNELRRLARHDLSHERPGHTLQATALVHEVSLRLIPQGEATREDRGKFIGIAAHVMRQILTEETLARAPSFNELRKQVAYADEGLARATLLRDPRAVDAARQLLERSLQTWQQVQSYGPGDLRHRDEPARVRALLAALRQSR